MLVNLLFLEGSCGPVRLLLLGSGERESGANLPLLNHVLLELLGGFWWGRGGH